jgi:hypothetical protein
VPTCTLALPLISGAYENYIGFVCFFSILEVAHAVRCSKTPPTRASLNNTVENIKNEVTYRALASSNLPPDYARVKGCQIDLYVMLTRGKLPDELRFGPQDAFFATLRKLMPEQDDTRVMWDQGL